MEAVFLADRVRLYYRAMHYNAKRGIDIACRLSARLSVCPSVTLVNHSGLHIYGLRWKLGN